MKKLILGLVGLIGMTCMAAPTGCNEIALDALSKSSTAGLPVLFLGIAFMLFAGFIVRYLGFFGYCLLACLPGVIFIGLFFI